MTENKVVPKLRFEEFQDDWESKQIGDVSRIYGRIGYRGYTVEDIVSRGEGAVTLSPSNFKDNRIDVNKATYISWFKYDESPEIKIQNGDILFVKTGSTYGKSAFVMDLDVKATINPQIIVLKDISISKKFLSYIVINRRIRKQIEEKVVGGAIPTMSQKEISKMFFHLPSLPEQQKITSFLSAVDEKLQQLTKKKELLSAYKKGVMQQIFSQDLRFKDVNGNNYPDWEEKKLGRLCELKNGYAFKSSKYVSEGYYSVVTIKNVQDGRMVDDFKTLDNIPANLESHQILYLDDILISMTGNVGRVCKVKFKNCVLNQRVGKIIDKNVFKDYLYYVLNSKKFLKSMENIGQGAAQMNIGKKDILAFKGIHPSSMEEQKKIANFLSSIDSKIDLVSTQIENTKAFKKGLLQQMFV